MTAPKIMLSTEQTISLLEHVPHYHITMLGPFQRSLGTTQQRAKIEVHYIVVASEREAIAAAHEWAQDRCRAHGVQYDPEEWTASEIMRCRCN